jgi:hypothetical protein
MEIPSTVAAQADSVATIRQLTFRKSIQIHCCLRAMMEMMNVMVK